MSIAVLKGARQRDPEVLFSRPSVEVETRADGAKILRSTRPLPDYERCIGEWLKNNARDIGGRDFLCERESNEADARWRRLTYREALAKVEAIGTWILAQGFTAETPVAVLSDNSIDHALISLACAHVGVPIASISPAYSLLSKDHAKLKSIIGQLTPGAIFVGDAAQFAGALAALEGLHTAKVVAGANATGRIVPFEELLSKRDEVAVAHAYAAVAPDTVAKILFTSGSTGEPKGVKNTQRMLTSSQISKAIGWRFLETTPPVTLDWLPWSHTFGANHNFNLILRNGGTMYIDNGKPAPGLLQRTIRNIHDVASNVYFNVPRGYDLLVAEMKKDAALAKAFFEPLQIVFYAGAALPQNTWEDLVSLSRAVGGAPVVLTSGWGSTETSPLATDCHFQAERSGNIGVPAAGVDVKLLPNGDKLEIRVKGPVVTPGYWRRDDITKSAFDEEGFYLIGDAVRLADASDPGKGFFFDGRVAEDFKLTTGTWVSVGSMRVAGIEALAPLAQDIVVTGHGRADIGFLIFANMAACREWAGAAAEVEPEQVLQHPAVVARVQSGLRALKAQGGGSSTMATRALLMSEPPSVDAGEITDKGYTNQRAVLARRAALVEELYAGGGRVITP